MTSTSALKNEMSNFPANIAMEQEVALLRAQLEASELKHTVAELRGVISQLQCELKESNQLLRKQRLPPRIKTTSTQRLQVAARQGWKCAAEECPLKITNPPHGLFTPDALFDVDHLSPWSESARHTGNLQALCAYCHSRKTRAECEQRFA